jgi:hypothetical protein
MEQSLAGARDRDGLASTHRGWTRMLLLVPAHPLDPRAAEPRFAAEAEAAARLGWTVGLVDHDELQQGRPGAALRRVPAGGGAAVYRGWMLGGDAYAGFERATADRGARLLTGAAAYRTAHELPGWYDGFAGRTPASVWTDGPSLDALAELARGRPWRAAVLRDYVKSAKHAWGEAAYVPDLGDTGALLAVARRLLELRDEDFTGGFVLREHEPLTGPELRTWWVAGRCRLVTAHPDDGGAAPGLDLDRDAGWLAGAVAGLGCWFVTVDLARRADGAVRVVEVGDGQVSGLPEATPPGRLLSALAGAGG